MRTDETQRKGVNCLEAQTQEDQVDGVALRVPVGQRLILGNWCSHGALGRPWGKRGAGLRELGPRALATRVSRAAKEARPEGRGPETLARQDPAQKGRLFFWARCLRLQVGDFHVSLGSVAPIWAFHFCQNPLR